MMLDHPAWYALSQRLVGKAGLYRYLVLEVIRPEPQMRILDIGCGTGELLRFLPPVRYVGFDSSPERVAAARRRFADRGTFRIADVQRTHGVEEHAYDVAVAVGVLHHLDDAATDRLCRLARAALGASGRLVTIDPAIVSGRSAIDRAITALDRGRHVRTAGAYRALIERHFAGVIQTVRNDLLRVPQTLVVFEAPRLSAAPPHVTASSR